MVDRELTEQVTGYFGLVMWSLQLAPQVYKTFRRKSTEGISTWMMLIWVISGCTLANYNIGLGVAIPLIVQPHIFYVIAAMCLGQELYYGLGWSKTKSWMMFIGLLVTMGGLEAGLVFAFQRAQLDQNSQAIQFFGVIPVVTILIGFLPQYWDIFRNHRVEGISHVFLFMDFTGSVFSTISLAYRPTIDALSLVNYIGIAAFDVGIFVLYYFFKWYNGNKGRTKDSDLDKEDARSEKTVEQMDEELGLPSSKIESHQRSP